MALRREHSQGLEKAAELSSEEDEEWERRQSQYQRR